MATLNGTGHDLPKDISECLTANEIARVIYWSRPDSSQPLQMGLWCETMRPLIFCPCFWPHLLILCCPSCCAINCMKKAHLNNAVVVTSSTVEIITMPTEVCCIPGCYRKAMVKKSIRPEAISDVMIDVKDSGFLTCCCPDLSKMRIMDGTTRATRHGGVVHIGTVIYAHTNLENLKDNIMSLRGGANGGGQIPMLPVMGAMGIEPRQVIPMAFPVEQEQGQFGQPQQYGNPQYGQPQQYGNPQYGQPQQFGNSQYGQPQQYGNPQYGQPQQFGNPQYGQPQQFGNPQYGQPQQYGNPQYGQPEM